MDTSSENGSEKKSHHKKVYRGRCEVTPSASPEEASGRSRGAKLTKVGAYSPSTFLKEEARKRNEVASTAKSKKTKGSKKSHKKKDPDQHEQSSGAKKSHKKKAPPPENDNEMSVSGEDEGPKNQSKKPKKKEAKKESKANGKGPAHGKESATGSKKKDSKKSHKKKAAPEGGDEGASRPKKRPRVEDDEKAASVAEYNGDGGGQYEKIQAKVVKLLNTLRRDMFQCTVYEQDASRSAAARKLVQSAELNKLQQKIRATKLDIRQVIHDLTKMNSDGPRWEGLEADEQGEVDVDEIRCTACGSCESTHENDIIMCDLQGCFRAYHQECLEPVITEEMLDASEDWFCWQCQCLTACLGLLEEEFEGRDFDVWEDVFPEALQENGQANRTVSGPALPRGETLLSDDTDSDDDDYDPDALRARRAAKKKAASSGKANGSNREDSGSESDSSSGGSGSGSEGESSNSNENDSKSQSGGEGGSSDDYNSDDTETSVSELGIGDVANLSDVSFATSDEEEGGSGEEADVDETNEGPKSSAHGIARRVGRRRKATAEVAPPEPLVGGDADKGREVARVLKGAGCLVWGTITDYVPDASDEIEEEEEGPHPRWECTFEERGKPEEYLCTREETEGLLKLFAVEKQKLVKAAKKHAAAEKTAAMLRRLEEGGLFDTGNIVTGPRSKSRVDYVALNDALFGDEFIAELDDDEEHRDGRHESEAVNVDDSSSSSDE